MDRHPARLLREAGAAARRHARRPDGARLDVIVNSAGYRQPGLVEEISEQEIRA